MKLQRTDFGSVLNASGARGFFGNKYSHQIGPFKPNWEGCTFVAKTTTLSENKGNMPMKTDGITQKEWFPKCVKVYFRKGLMLNAVGLSGPGAKTLFETGRWQEREEPFFISFMAIKKTPEERLAETKEFVELFAKYLPGFKSPVGLQINYSCPNVGLDPSCLVDEVKLGLKIASELGVVLMPKFNVLAPVSAVKAITEDKNCDAICVSNTIPWGKFPEWINWKELFGTDISPLEKLGGGGLSGAPLIPLVLNWLHDARYSGINKPVNAGGGILSVNDLGYFYGAGASSIFIGSVATLRPRRVKEIVRVAHQLFH